MLSAEPIKLMVNISGIVFQSEERKRELRVSGVPLTAFFSWRSALSASRSASILDFLTAAFLVRSSCTKSSLPTSDKACVGAGWMGRWWRSL